MKDAPAVRPLAEVLRRTAAWDRVCVTSFSASRLRAARRAFDRQVCMAASPIGTAVVRFGGPRGRYDPRRPGRAGAPGRARPPAGHAPRPGGAAGPDRRALRPGSGPVATHAFVGRAHALGLQVHVWTINSPALMTSLLDLGVDGIMTDETVALRES